MIHSVGEKVCMITNRLFPSFAATKLYKILDTVEAQNTQLLHLTANENVMSELALRFYRSPMGLRYDFGRGKDGVISVDFFGNFAATTYPQMHDILDTAYTKAKKMLHAAEVNLHCLSGAHAMLCALLGASKPGDVIMSVREEDGGHFCTKKIIEVMGRKHVFAVYDSKALTFDIQKTVELFARSHAKILYLDTSVLLRPHPLKEIKSLLPSESIIIYDASHTLGLIMGNQFQSPLLEGADIISANTHKTFPGPHKGLLAFRTSKIAERVNSVIQNTLYSTFHTNNLLALAVSIIEFDVYGREYAKQIIHNSNELGKALERNNFKVRKLQNEYSFNHQVHMFIDRDVRAVVKLFLKNGIAISTSDSLGGKSFIRLGTQELTKRGMKEKEMNQIAAFIRNVLDGATITNKVKEFNASFRKTQYSFPFEDAL